MQSIGTKLKEGAAWTIEKSCRFSRVVSQVVTLALDSLLLGSKLNPNSPKEIKNVALTGLSTTALLYLPFNVDLIFKLYGDIRTGIKGKNYLVILLGSAKIVEIAAIIGLMGANFAASMEALQEHSDRQAQLYRVMTFAGEATLLLGILNLLGGMYTNHKTLKLLQSIHSDFQTHAIVKGLSEEIVIPIPADHFHASQVRFCMDKDTLKRLLEALKNLFPENVTIEQKLLKIAENNIQLQQRVNLGGQIVLTIAGYGAIAIEKIYTPDSLVTALLNTLFSAGYTSKTVYETTIENLQRCQISRTLEE